MTAGKLTGSASISFEQPVYIESAAAIAGKKEGDGPLGNLFDMISKDPLFGTQTWEAAESTCLLYTSPSPRDGLLSRMPSSA